MPLFKSVLPFLGAALFLAVLVSPLASSLPDGLEDIAENLGFSDLASEKPMLSSPLPDYTLPALGETPFSTAVSGLIGTLVCFLLPFTLYLLRRR